jgi:hypothetical protein
MKRLLPVLAALPCWVTSLLAQTAEVPAPPVPRLPGLEVEKAEDASAAEAVSQYLHFLSAPEAIEKPDVAGADRLQTAVVRFEKDGVIVDLVGVVHLADAAYFADLNQRLQTYDVVLYEMVGGPMQSEKPADSAVAEEMGSIHRLQQLAKSFLGLEYQTEAIDYSPGHFVHADVEWLEFDSLMKSRNETILTLLTRTMALADEDGGVGLASDEAAMQAMLQNMLNALLTGNSAELKRSVAPLLSEAETFITRLESKDGTVLVSERNRIVMEKLAEVRAKQGKGTYAIFYGAAHMPDFEVRLLAEGFVKGGTTWLDAWTIPTGPAATTTTSSPAKMFLQLLSQNPEVMNELKNLGSLLEGIGGKLKEIPSPAQP